MWHLFGDNLRSAWRVHSDPQPLAQAILNVQTELTASRQAMDQIYSLMVELKQAGGEDTPAYQSMLSNYLKLSHLAARATEVLKAEEDKHVKEIQASQPRPAPVDLTGIDPCKSTLGPAGRPGNVSKGVEVSNLQKFLTAVGFTVPASGDFDKKTQQALLLFQDMHKLKVTGVVGAETRKLINDILKEQ